MTFQSSSNNFHSFQGLDGMKLAKWVKLCSIPFQPLLILLNPNNEFYLPLYFIPSYSTNLSITFVTFIPSHSTKSYECSIWSSFIARYIHLWKSQKLWLDSIVVSICSICYLTKESQKVLKVLWSCSVLRWMHLLIFFFLP